MNQLTPEQLDMIKRLQPLFKEKMGDWQVGDIIILPDGDLDCIFKADVVTWRMMPQLSDAFDDCLRIPKPIDWQNPERGLWGMVDKNRWTIISHNSNDWIIQDNSNKRTKLCDSIIADPFAALLMALVQQERV